MPLPKEYTSMEIMGWAIAFVTLLLISPTAYGATTHTVGDSTGWTTGFNYTAWSSSQTFVVGDTLLFNYGASHAVDEVSEANYQSCNTGNPISSNSSSPTSIPLTLTATTYFICPRSNHCQQGMKLAVTVVAAGTPPFSLSPPPPPPPPPGGSGAAALLAGCRNGLVVGLSLVLAALLVVIR